jgi:uncharacterized integral membrane protein (TIGR00698 family)
LLRANRVELMLQLRFSRAQALAPGVGVALMIGAAATFLSEHYSAPVMLFALLLGMAFSFLTEAERTHEGIEFAAKSLLRIGVALLGLRIGWSEVGALGWHPIALLLLLVTGTILVSIALARLMGFNPLFGFLSGGATAICGASAAMALAAALPPHDKKEQATLFTVIGVSVLSTLAMVTYPMIVEALDLDAREAGIFIGATIHDVAQVVGAGYAVSPETGDTATLVKLIRVALLLPVILVAGQITRRQAKAGSQRPPLLPGFVASFVALVVLNGIVSLPATLVAAGSELSRWCLVAAIAAIGMKTRLAAIVQLGMRPVILMVLETAILAAATLAVLKAGWL